MNIPFLVVMFTNVIFINRISFVMLSVSKILIIVGAHVINIKRRLAPLLILGYEAQLYRFYI